MTTWKQQLKKYNSLREQIAVRKEKKEGELRFGRCSVRASDVAGQYYCEKIEMEYLCFDLFEYYRAIRLIV